MQGRSFTSLGYRYGFNGKENDNEVKGVGNQQDYGMRFYDPRVGRFLSVDPLTKSYPWYTPYQFAGNDVIRNSDLDGKEPWLRNTIEAISKNRSAITAVSASFTMESGGILSVARGMAVDPAGNVLIYNQNGGLAALQFGFSTNAGMGAAINYTWYNDGVPTLKQLLGGGSAGGISGGWKEIISVGVGDEYNNGANVGSTFSVGIGYSGLPVGGAYQKSNTFGLILTGEEYDKVYNSRKAVEKQSIEDQLNFNYQQALEAGGNKRPNYSKALFQSQSTGISANYVPVEGKNDVFEITYDYRLSVYPNALVNGQGKEVYIDKSYKTGVQVQKDNNGNYISTNYKP